MRTPTRHPRPYSPTLLLRARLRRLEAELMEVWAMWESSDVEPYSEGWIALMCRVHDLRTAILETAIALEQRKHRRGKL